MTALTDFSIGNLVKVTNHLRSAFGRIIIISSPSIFPFTFSRAWCRCGDGSHNNLPLFNDPWERDYCVCELSFLYASPSSIPLEEAAFLISQLDESSFLHVISEIKAALP